MESGFKPRQSNSRVYNLNGVFKELGMGISEVLKIKSVAVTGKAKPTRTPPSLSGNMRMRKFSFSHTSHKCTTSLHPSNTLCTLTQRNTFWQRYVMHSSTNSINTSFRNTHPSWHQCLHTDAATFRLISSAPQKCISVCIYKHTYTLVHIKGCTKWSYLSVSPWDSAMPLFLNC